MIEFSIREIIVILITIVSAVINIVQWKQIKTTQKEKFVPIYNGLIGLFNDIKLKILKYSLKQKFIVGPKNPYKEVETLRWNFFEFTKEAISHLDSFRESIVPIIKSIDENEDRIFKGADFGLTPEEKRQKKLIVEKMEEAMRDFPKIKRETEFEKLHS